MTTSSQQTSLPQVVKPYAGKVNALPSIEA